MVQCKKKKWITETDGNITDQQLTRHETKLSIKKQKIIINIHNHADSCSVVHP